VTSRTLSIAVSICLTASGAAPCQNASSRLESFTLQDLSYHRVRRIWVYTPEDYAAHPAEKYPLIAAFDGDEYRDTMPLPHILDTLYASGKAPAFVAVLIDNGEGTMRIGDLGNSSRMLDFLGRQLVPWMRAHYRATTDPHHVIITGSSAGGLAAAYAAFEHPELFGNVLSQSGAFWRGAEASNAALT
jgi:enterochelin esterase-like enzyme